MVGPPRALSTTHYRTHPITAAIAASSSATTLPGVAGFPLFRTIHYADGLKPSRVQGLPVFDHYYRFFLTGTTWPL